MDYNLADSGVHPVSLRELLSGGATPTLRDLPLLCAQCTWHCLIAAIAMADNGEVSHSSIEELLKVDLHYPPVGGTLALRERTAAWHPGAGPGKWPTADR